MKGCRILDGRSALLVLALGVTATAEEQKAGGAPASVSQLEEAVIYKAGPRKGEVYARGILTHTQDEHEALDLGTIRWHLVVHNVAGPSYTLGGGGTAAQFD